MNDVRGRALSLQHWAGLMGRDLPEAERQALQPVRVEDGRLKLFSGMLNLHFSEGTRIGARLSEGRILLAAAEDGPELGKAGWWDDGTCVDLQLPEEARDALPGGEPVLCLLVKSSTQLELMPIRIEEHDPDILGPRIIDEFVREEDGQYGSAIRHVVRGLPFDEWTDDRIRELADLVSAEPFERDPVPGLAEGEDWVAWRTRNKILRKPGADDEPLRLRLEKEVFGDQRREGSWDGHVVKTAYGILHALSVDVAPGDERVQRAASWLLEQPEPVGRPGMWMLDAARLRKWSEKCSGMVDIEGAEFMVTSYTEDDHDLFRAMESQQEIPSCTRNHHAGCDAMMHPSATAAMALCACGHAGHARLKVYASTMYQHSAMFGYFCSCWGILDSKRKTEPAAGDGYPDFDRRAAEHPIALAALPYGHGRDAEDLCALGRLPRYPRMHRPDLSDTNGWTPYYSRDIGSDAFVGLDGAYWENADCWAKPNRALALFPGWVGSIAEFFALFQCHLYQTPLGEWNQGYVSGIFRMIEAVTRQAREAGGAEAEPILCFARRMLLRTVPWLRHHQQDDGLWHLGDLPRHGDAGRPPDPRLGTYHIVSVLHEFGLLERLRPGRHPVRDGG